MSNLLTDIKSQIDEALNKEATPDKTPMENAKEKTSGIRKWIEDNIGPFWGGFIVGALNMLLAVYIFSKFKGLEFCPEKWKEKLETDMTIDEYIKSAIITAVSAYLVTLVIYFIV